MKHLSPTTPTLPNLLRKLVAFVMTAALLVLALMFSAVLLAVILLVGALAFIYLWWKTRHLRKQMQQFSAQAANMGGAGFKGETFEGEVVEGEVIRVEASRDAK